jgi:hypothetical protein
VTTSDLVRAVEHGAHTVPQLAAVLNVPQWDAVLGERLHEAVLRLDLVAVGGGRYDVPGGAR